MADPKVTGEPVDSYQALVNAGENIAQLGSCSMPGAGNKGCAYYRICRFKKYRDELQRPGNVAVATILGDGTGNTSNKSCWYYYQSGDHNERKNGDSSGVLVEIIGYEGDMVESRSSVALHQKPDRMCEGCLKGACLLREVKLTTKPVPEFETWTKRKATGQGAKLRRELMERVPAQEQGRIMEHFDRQAPNVQPTSPVRPTTVPSSPFIRPEDITGEH